MVDFPEEGPEQYSWWMYLDRKASPHETIIKIQAWHKSSSGGSVSLKLFTFNGHTGNHGVSRPVPDELKTLTIEHFWRLIEDGKLAKITLSAGEIEPDRGLFAVGDPIGPPAGKLNP